MAHISMKNDAPSRAESHSESSERFQRSSLRQRLSVNTQYYFKLGTNPVLSVHDRPRDLDNENKLKRKRPRSSKDGHQKSPEPKKFSLCAAISQCRTVLKRKDRTVWKRPARIELEGSTDESTFEGPSRKRFKGDVPHGHVFIEPQHHGGHQSGPVRPPVASSSRNHKVSPVTPFRRDEPTLAKKRPYGLTSSVDDSSFEGPSKKKFKGDVTHHQVFIEPQHHGGHHGGHRGPVRPPVASSSRDHKVLPINPFRRDEPAMGNYGLSTALDISKRDEVSTLFSPWYQHTIENMKRKAQRERQEAARVTHMGLDCNILSDRADNQVRQVYKQLDKIYFLAYM